MTAFAIFCADDGSLTFYKRDTVPAAGDEFEGKVVSNVYTDAFETTIYGSNGTPWHNERTSILSVNFVDVIAPIHISRWFFQCSNLESIDFDNLDTSNTQSMSDVFNGCSSLISLDLSNINTSSATSMSRMFYGCSNLTTIIVSERWSTAALTSSTKMFEGCTSLVGAIPYDSSVTDKTHANYQTGYLTYKRFVIPEDMLILNTTLYDLADKIRVLSAKTDSMNPIQMTEVLAGILDAKEVLF